MTDADRDIDFAPVSNGGRPAERWIVIPGWDRYQHPDVLRNDKPPGWVKLHVHILADEAFLRLSDHRRLLFLELLLEYASTRARLPLDTRSLSRRLQLRVTTADLETLNQAGFITFSASKPQAPSKQPASLDKRREEQRSNRAKDQNHKPPPKGRQCPLCPIIDPIPNMHSHLEYVHHLTGNELEQATQEANR